MGKAYANRKQEKDRPAADFYSTPVPVFKRYMENYFPYGIPKDVYEPAAGEGHISKVLRGLGCNVIEDDLRTTGKNFLEFNGHYEWIITNPPFSLFDEFVMAAKRNSNYFAMIMKTNFFGAHGRNVNGLWNGLRHLTVFDRQIDYRGHNDTGCAVGNLITGVGIWDMSYHVKSWTMNVMDVNDLCTLGSYKGE